ncbi:hypothetical protein KCU81_g5883, partial [Aureobasidium melanogenum]|uniref:F-box domain-containing protein n=1 Tax=Aureobasidium melanogenum (strain CBS 110374) TaxID=1043003 RepID=A0A074WAT9_AURM1
MIQIQQNIDQLHFIYLHIQVTGISDPASDMLTIHNLPNELLLGILSYLDDHLDVRDCSQTSSILRAIAHHPTLDHKLFRSKNVKHKLDILDMDTFVLHPMINQTMFAKDMLLPEDPYILTTDCADEFDQEHGIPILRTRAHKNNATSPPVDYLNFDGIIIENKNNNAVTVGQIFKELISRNVHESKHDEDWDWYQIHACNWYVCWVDSGKVVEQHKVKHHQQKADTYTSISHCSDIRRSLRTYVSPVEKKSSHNDTSS